MIKPNMKSFSHANNIVLRSDIYTQFKLVLKSAFTQGCRKAGFSTAFTKLLRRAS